MTLKFKQTRMEELETLVLQWAAARGILTESTATQQFMKTIEEFGEVVLGINKDRVLLIKDGIGDVIVTLIIVQRLIDEDFMFPLYVPEICSPQLHSIDRIRMSVLDCQIKLGTVSTYLLGRKAVGGVAMAIGELARELEFIAGSYGLSLEGCLEMAYDEIKDRKGKMVAGVFMKEADLIPHQEPVTSSPSDGNAPDLGIILS